MQAPLEGANPKGTPTYYSAKFSFKKLHEMKKIGLKQVVRHCEETFIHRSEYGNSISAQRLLLHYNPPPPLPVPDDPKPSYNKDAFQ